MATPPLDIEFTPAALVVRIVRGATEGDPVRMHGAIAATLDIHPQVVPTRDVFAPALRLAREHSPRCHGLLADAIQRSSRSRRGLFGRDLRDPPRSGTPGT